MAKTGLLIFGILALLAGGLVFGFGLRRGIRETKVKPAKDDSMKESSPLIIDSETAGPPEKPLTGTIEAAYALEAPPMRQISSTPLNMTGGKMLRSGRRKPRYPQHLTGKDTRPNELGRRSPAGRDGSGRGGRPGGRGDGRIRGGRIRGGGRTRAGRGRGGAGRLSPAEGRASSPLSSIP